MGFEELKCWQDKLDQYWRHYLFIIDIQQSMELSIHCKTSSLIFLLFSLFFFLLPSKACNPVDKQALLQFKHKITSHPSKLLQSWTSSSDCCTSWEGVACDSSKRVVNLTRPGLVSEDDFIVDTYMTGTLSAYLGNLSNLQVLDLSDLKDLGSNSIRIW